MAAWTVAPSQTYQPDICPSCRQKKMVIFAQTQLRGDEASTLILQCQDCLHLQRKNVTPLEPIRAEPYCPETDY